MEAHRTCTGRAKGSLKRLGVHHIDLFYRHRVDPNGSIKETVGAIAEPVQAGKVRYLGLTSGQASATELKKLRRTSASSSGLSSAKLCPQSISA